MTPLNNFDLDYVAGWVGTFTFEVDQYSVCAIPLEPIIPVVNECAPASYLVEYENGTDIQEGEIPSGGELTIVVPDPIECDPATVELVNTDSTLLLTESVDCGTTEQIIAPDATVHLRKANNGTIHVEAIPSGVTENYVVADNNITVNQVSPFTIHATDPLNIRLHNQQGGDIVPQSVVYQGNSNHVTITVNTSSFVPVGATLMKTGQTTSYRTGDDGDIEAGRATSFFILASNNPFGNTNRFTSELGTQTYTNSIVIDWSTYNGSTVLGYSRNSHVDNLVTWNQAIDNALAYSISSYTSGWRLPNLLELMNICFYGNSGGSTNQVYQYPVPYTNVFNISSNVFWASTTLGSSTSAFVLGTSNSEVYPFPKTNNRRALYCRTFTVTGTTLS
jgi:hypothetical protein